MPGCKSEMDEQKYRFMNELQLLKQEKKQFKEQLEHCYAYQQKKYQSAGGTLRQQSDSMSSSAKLKEIQIKDHLMCVQWSLKHIGRLSLQNRFQKIQSYR